MLRLALIGLGKIARDQHLPAIARTPEIELVAVASLDGGLDGVPSYTGLEALRASGIAIDAVALCTPPQGRRALAAAAVAAGWHVLLEKPPGATLAELAPLREQAQNAGRTLFATWHSRFAPAVEPARQFLAGRTIHAVRVMWKEDVRVWHPNQAWIWEPGGLGVFDPGINALSIVTRILPHPVFVTAAELSFPANRATPIAAGLTLSDGQDTPIGVELDWRQTGPQSWDIVIETDLGRLSLHEGGKRLVLEGRTLVDAAEEEYRAIYRRFLGLIAAGESDMDLTPLTLVADAFLLGRRLVVDAFD